MVFSGSHHRALKSQQWQDTPRKWHILQEYKNGPFLVDLEHFWVPRNYSQITRLADVVSLIRSSHSSILNTAHHEISSYFGSGFQEQILSLVIGILRSRHSTPRNPIFCKFSFERCKIEHLRQLNDQMEMCSNQFDLDRCRIREGYRIYSNMKWWSRLDSWFIS